VSVAGVVIYHNPRCSKSRGALQILRDKQIEHEVVEYLEEPPDRGTLEHLLDLLGGDPAELVRRDARFRELGLGPESCASRDAVVELLLAHPELMQRPLVVRGDRAVLARPSEKLNELL
jgi:arsenate reductase